MKHRLKRGWSLSVDHQNLLRATLCEGETARCGWQAWRQAVDFEQLDVASYRLLPMLYCNLQANGIQDPLMPRLQGVYKRVWVENQLLFSAVDSLVSAMTTQGIEAVWLGEAAIARGAFGGNGLRSLAHATIGVLPRSRQRASRIAIDAGWQQQHGPRSGLRYLFEQTSDFCHPDDYTLRLTWQPLINTPWIAAEHSALQRLSPETQLRFILQDFISSRPGNRLVLLADIFHLLSEIFPSQFKLHPRVKLLKNIVGLPMIKRLTVSAEY